MKNFGLRLALTGMIGLVAPVILSAGIFDLTPVVCNHKALWIFGAPVFVFAVAFLLLGVKGLLEPLMEKPGQSGKQKSFATVKAVAVLAVVAALIQLWITSEC